MRGGWQNHTQTAAAAAAVKSSTVTWHHSNNYTVEEHRSAKPHTSCQVPLCHVHACCSCCELVDNHTLSLPAYTRVTNFATFSAAGMGVGLYVGRLIREYIRYLCNNVVRLGSGLTVVMPWSWEHRPIHTCSRCHTSRSRHVISCTHWQAYYCKWRNIYFELSQSQ